MKLSVVISNNNDTQEFPHKLSNNSKLRNLYISIFRNYEISGKSQDLMEL